MSKMLNRNFKKGILKPENVDDVMRGIYEINSNNEIHETSKEINQP